MTVYRLHVFLLGIAPPIWRRVEVDSESTLAQLHTVLQAAMGWQNCHLHEFKVGGQRYGEPDPELDQPGNVISDSSVKLSTVLPGRGASLLYTYDFGDDWDHSVILEDMVSMHPATKYPHVIDGARACPPEDAGGPYAYADLVAILAKQRHGRYGEMRAWVGRHFDPEKFSARAANLRLQSAR